MELTQQQIEQIVKDTVSKLAGASGGALSGSATSGEWLCDTAEQAVQSAKRAQEQLSEMSMEQRGKLIAAMRAASIDNAEYLAKIAVEETGYGIVSNKTAKNLLAAEKTPGIEDLNTGALSGDYGLTITEMAPYGVIGSITPSTNPTSSVINNSISMIAAGNSVVYNPHPAAKRASTETMRVLNEAIVAAGGPNALNCTVKEPTIETSNIIMNHPDIKILSITGGEAVVNVAMKTGKKVIAAGPGNPPVIVDETAIINEAAKDIVDGASFDNNVLCIAEKEVFVVDSVADALMSGMELSGAVKVSGGDIEKIVKTVLVQKEGKYMINRNYVGRSAQVILRDSCVAFDGTPRLIICDVDEKHPLVTTEMMMPVLGVVRVANVDEAISKAIIAEGGCHHTAMMHSQNVTNLSNAARALDTTIFVKNAPSYAGLGFEGEGYTTLTIATPTGEGLTSARSFTRSRRCVLHGNFRII
ncbi:MAG: aldehyde dehydrogenase EutE [Clostridia bacterium]|jgi:acyl-CoA reductase-like NAD-dependent aldehyde dehydrogenase|nr:aldehyde dehydrogenase EutE [Clostridia bacterium]MBT7122741.1 aldehyde dehydrogenase EutE [Clostridia bacterium]